MTCHCPGNINVNSTHSPPFIFHKEVPAKLLALKPKVWMIGEAVLEDGKAYFLK
jgi:hypothetical protein